MNQRVNHFAVAPQAMDLLLQQETYLQQQFGESAAINKTLWELIKLRVSQINQCAFCIDMHSKDALRQGERAERIIALSAWRNMPLYDEAERAALAWAELLVSNQDVDDASYQQALLHFGEKDLVDLTMAVNAINSWNRMARAFKPEVGPYQPK